MVLLLNLGLKLLNYQIKKRKIIIGSNQYFSLLLKNSINSYKKFILKLIFHLLFGPFFSIQYDFPSLYFKFNKSFLKILIKIPIGVTTRKKSLTLLMEKKIYLLKFQT